MAWIKLDNNWSSTPEKIAAGIEGRALWLEGRCYCSRLLTDGTIPSAALPLLGVLAGVAPDRAGAVAERLVDLGLWGAAKDGYEDIGYLGPDGQESRDQVEERRVAGRDRQAKARARKAERDAERNGVTDGVTNAEGNGVTGVTRHGVSHAHVTEEDVDTDKRENTHARSREPSTAFERDFEVWLKAYPRRVSRPQAFKAYQALRRKGVSADDLLTAAQRYAENGRRTNRPIDKTRYPATFLNNGWDDWLPGGVMDREAAAASYQRNSYEVPK